jgi:hypothetical protein
LTALSNQHPPTALDREIPKRYLSAPEKRTGAGAIVTEPQSESKKRRDIFIYLWLVLSLLLNISGIASIVDGFVQWTSFLKDLLSMYQAWIREPISWVVHLVWPSWWPKIPAWALDVFIVWSGLFLAININNVRVYGESYWKSAVDSEGILKGTAGVVFFFLFAPVIYPTVAALGHDEDRREREEARQVLRYYIFLVAMIIVLMFLNWQLKKAGQQG